MPTDRALDKLREQARLHQDEDRDAVALELCSLYLLHRPEDRDVLLVHAQCLRNLGRKSEAEEVYLQLLSTGDGRPWHQLHAELGMLYHDWGKYALAEEHWEQSCCARNPPGWAWIMRGANLARCERFDEAADCQRKAVNIREECDRDEAFLNLGYVLRAQGKYSDATDAFRSALAITPDYPEAITALNGLQNWADSLQQAWSLLSE